MFSRKTIQFLKDVTKKNDPVWFEKNKSIYIRDVKEPFIEVLEVMESNFKNKLPHYRFSSRSISRPTRQPGRSSDKSGSKYKDFIACLMAPPKTSRFEYPPGFYLSIGTKEILFGAGVYMPSGPQFRAIRLAIQKDPKKFAQILANPKFKKTFGKLNSEIMQRPPRNFTVDPKYQHLLLYKSYSVKKEFTLAELTHASFKKKLVATAEAALPLLHWLEEALGTTSAIQKSTSTKFT